MLTYLAPVLVFGVLIFVHELGHFLAAKAMGVYAPRFSIGFGPALFRFRRGETEYILAALPLGGFVRMASRLDEESAFLEGGSEEKSAGDAEVVWEDPNGMMPFGPNPVPPDRWFESKPLPARILIMIAGVTMNALLAFVVYTGLILHDGRTILPPAVLGHVEPVAAAPQLARLHLGDTVRAVNGRDVHDWNQLLEAVSVSSRLFAMRTNRDSVSVPLDDSLTASTVLGALDMYMPAVIDSVVDGQPAAAAGFQHGDSVVSIAGEPVLSWSDLTHVVERSSGQPLAFEVIRADGRHTITVTPRATPSVDPGTGKPDTVGKIGTIRMTGARLEPVGFGEGLVEGASRTWEQAGLIVSSVVNLFRGSASVKDLGGPIRITQLSVSAARGGFENLLGLLAVLSLSLAVLNLFPIPILDGGQILINVIESAKGSPLSMRTREYLLRFGLVAIGLLFVTVMYNDTREWGVRLFHWVGTRFGG